MDADPLGQNDKGGPPGAAAPTGGEEEMDADPLGQNDKDGPRKKPPLRRLFLSVRRSAILVSSLLKDGFNR